MARWQVWVVTWHHMARKQLDNFGVSHLVVIVRINLTKKIIDFLGVVDHFHFLDQEPELLFVQDTVAPCVNLLEDVGEVLEELFVFL